MTNGEQLPSLLREQLEQDVPATIDLWPAIVSRLPAPSSAVRPHRRQRLVLGGLVTILLLGVVLGTSPAARAAVTAWLRTIAGVRFYEQTTPGVPGPVTIISKPRETRMVAVHALAEEVPVPVRLPTPPADYFLSSMATVYPPGAFRNGWDVVLVWRPDASAESMGTSQHVIELTVSGAATKVGVATQEGMTEEVMVAGVPTALTRGIWLNSGQGMQWQTEALGEEYLMLSWMDGEERYQLRSTEPGFLSHLITMAATIRNP